MLPLQFRKGEVLEWLKRHAWKACIPLKGIVGSNPILSAFLMNANKGYQYEELDG